MTQVTKTGCPICKHYQFDGTCTAYPEGILFGFLAGLDAHTKPTKNQNNGIVFEWISPQAQKARSDEARAKRREKDRSTDYE
ncbi:hypothetical protein [Chamaesiphon sp. VAR_48_metabat_403]|uniref:hypothetical protein n=1 Tax=Chamaesiphon sp. VAR_48_metabat_403 TaxID=2964700 RepID=UPI00286DB55B|nr:hypothetical protein [Chamaesiphon sp. VAR_48_metabat_403]